MGDYSRGKTNDLRWIMCGLCDTSYDPNGPDAKNHEHPEPQSGEPRAAWLRSGLKYSDWIKRTNEGMAWANRIKQQTGG